MNLFKKLFASLGWGEYVKITLKSGRQVILKKYNCIYGNYVKSEHNYLNLELIAGGQLKYSPRSLSEPNEVLNAHNHVIGYWEDYI